MSDTPRTDGMIQPFDHRDCVTGDPISVVHVDDCRALERELGAANHYRFRNWELKLKAEEERDQWRECARELAQSIENARGEIKEDWFGFRALAKFNELELKNTGLSGHEQESQKENGIPAPGE